MKLIMVRILAAASNVVLDKLLCKYFGWYISGNGAPGRDRIEWLMFEKRNGFNPKWWIKAERWSQ